MDWAVHSFADKALPMSDCYWGGKSRGWVHSGTGAGFLGGATIRHDTQKNATLGPDLLGHCEIYIYIYFSKQLVGFILNL